MERTTSRPPSGGRANWAIFFAPLAATGVVIVGAMIFFWVSDSEPADRPAVERVDLRELEPAEGSIPLSSVNEAGEVEQGERAEKSVTLERLGARRALAAAPPASEGGPSEVAAPSSADEGEDLEDGDEDFADTSERVERTPEQRQAAKARLMESIQSVPFMAPIMDRLRERRLRAEQGAETIDQEVLSPEATKEVPLERAQDGDSDPTTARGAAGAAAQ